MTPTQLAKPRSERRHARGTVAPAGGTDDRRRRSGRLRRTLGAYIARDDRPRELIAQSTPIGSILVLDRDSLTRGDSRLIAHLGEDEPLKNAEIVCADYLRDEHVERRLPRPVKAEDATTAPFSERQHNGSVTEASSLPHPMDRFGRVYRLELFDTGMSIPELRWCRCGEKRLAPPGPISLREVVATLQSYEPPCTTTAEALARASAGAEVSSTVLRAELDRVLESPIVLNRALREAVVARVQREEVSMSEIAVRCGRLKRDGRGNASGETSWLARRIGLLPDGGQDTPTPWIHSDVLGLIARKGLGISPREVEL